MPILLFNPYSANIMSDVKLQESNTLRLPALMFSIDMKWIDNIESIATFTGRKVGLLCRA